MRYIREILFLSNANFFLELFIFMLICFINVKRRDHFYYRLLTCCALGLLFYFLPSLNVGGFSFAYTIIFIYLILCSYFLYKTNFITLFTLTVCSWALQHLTWNTCLLLLDNVLGTINLPKGVPVTIYLICIFIYALIMGIVFRKKKDYFSIAKPNAQSLIGSIVLLFITVFLSSFVQIVDEWTWIYRLYSISTSLIIVLLVIGVFDQTRAEKEKIKYENDNKILKELIKEQAHQQKLNKETYDIINMKIHDIKNQINVIKEMKTDEQNKYLDELKELVDIYGSFAKTGNEVLDVILNQKSLLCKSKKIKFTFICDGEALKIFNPESLTSLFGNLIDNAIEATSRENEDNRLIKLTAMNRKNFLCIHIENYCSNQLTFKDGLPLTTKENATNHGFGTRSIKYIVKRYNGELKMNFNNNIFSVNILIPIQSNNAN